MTRASNFFLRKCLNFEFWVPHDGSGSFQVYSGLLPSIERSVILHIVEECWFGWFFWPSCFPCATLVVPWSSIVKEFIGTYHRKKLKIYYNWKKVFLILRKIYLYPITYEWDSSMYFFLLRNLSLATSVLEKLMRDSLGVVDRSVLAWAAWMMWLNLFVREARNPEPS